MTLITKIPASICGMAFSPITAPDAGKRGDQGMHMAMNIVIEAFCIVGVLSDCMRYEHGISIEKGKK